MNHLGTQENIKDNFAKIEQLFPVDKWVVDGVHVWPYIRIKLYYTMLTSGKVTNSRPNETIKNSKVLTIYKKFNKIFKVINAFFSLNFFFFNLKQKKILFFGAHFHRVLQNGKYFNRFYDSIVEHHALHDMIYMLEYQRVYSNNYNQKAIIALSRQLNNYKLLNKFKKSVKIDESSIFLEDYDSFCIQILDLKINPKALGIRPTDLVNWTHKMKTLQGFYFRFYKNVNPEKVILLGYYGYDDLYAGLITANQLSIKTVDFQHGPQTNVHMAYSNWSKVPKMGFNTMPKEFWNWDENSKENIDEWASTIKNITTKVVGQPYIPYCKKYLKSSSSGMKVILFSMQTSPLELLTPKLIELIKSTDYSWILRLHPRNSTKLDQINMFLKKKNINNKAIVQSSSEVPLPEILSKSILHITNYSGCTIESKIMGIPTLLIHKVGKEMFLNYIDNELVYYLDQDQEDFIDQAKLLIDKMESLKYKSEYLEIFNPFT